MKKKTTPAEIKQEEPTAQDFGVGGATGPSDLSWQGYSPSGNPGVTGRYLVLLREKGGKNAVNALQSITKVKLAMSSDFTEKALDIETLGGADGLVFEDLGIAVMDAPPDQSLAMRMAVEDEGQPEIMAMEPERVVYAFSPGMATRDYLRGLRRGMEIALEEALGQGGYPDLDITQEVAAQDEANFTWGLQATRVNTSRFNGRGISVAVLDTGLDLGHPDVIGRQILTASFITGQPVQDGNGHGTHCIGTSCGKMTPQRLPRYGIAHQARILAGKVLSNAGSGSDSGILAGIQWAIQNGARVVSMSLGARVASPNQPFSAVFNTAGQRALNAGCLIVAAAGNDSNRQTSPPWAVSHPANCPTFMAVGAVDRNLRVANFSNAGLNPNGGKVDLAGPGVDVDSSWPIPLLRRTISGTSMATPHVAGIAALLSEAHGLRGAALWQALVSSCRPLAASSRDVGAGLVQAPQ